MNFKTASQLCKKVTKAHKSKDKKPQPNNNRHPDKPEYDRKEIKIATLNAEGIVTPGKRRLLEEWAENNRLDVVAIQETHFPRETKEGGTGNFIDEKGNITRNNWIW